jgi:hypothetical protein
MTADIARLAASLLSERRDSAAPQGAGDAAE